MYPRDRLQCRIALRVRTFATRSHPTKKDAADTSPELHPAHPGTPDLSLYVLDPRETYLRRSRATPHPRTRSTDVGTGHEVWAGKGLISWALGEAKQGKNLITGRLITRPEFLNVTAPPAEGVSALEALVAAHTAKPQTDVEAWGIEISIGLKSALSASGSFPGPLHHAVENGSVTGVLELEEDDVADSPAPTPVARPSTVARIPSFPAARTASSSHLAPRPIPRNVSSSPAGPSRPRSTPVSRKKIDERSKLADLDVNKAIPAPVSRSDLTAQVSTALGNMTEGERSVLTPDVLRFLEKLAGSHGAQIVAAEKRIRDEEVSKADAAPVPTKRPRNNVPRSETVNGTYAAPISKCSNCSTTKSSVWRQQQDPRTGETVRVCNACGLYYQKRNEARPASMWQNEDSGVVRGRGRTKASDRAGFKRTLTQVAEKDSDRINNRRKATTTRAKTPAPRARAEPQTSPPRPSVPLPRSVRVAAAATSVGGMSSPGGWQDEFSGTPMHYGGNSAGFTHHRPMPSLAMPLSDDGTGQNDAQPLQWHEDITAFFNVDGGFNMGAGAEASPSRSPAQPISSMDARNVSSALRNTMMAPPTSDAVEASEDDILSELFNRTSSFGRSSSLGRTSSFGRSSSFGEYGSSPSQQNKFDFSQLPPSSPPAIPSNLPHSALLFSSPSDSPADPSPRLDGKSPNKSGLRNELALNDKDGNIHEILSKLNNSDLLDLFNAFPAAS